MNHFLLSTGRFDGWMQRLLMAAEVESAAYQFGLMASPTRINECLAGNCLENAAPLRTELPISQ